MKELKVLETEPVGLAGQIKEKATEKIGRMLENVKFSFKHSLLKAGKSMALFSDPAIALAVVKKDGLALEYMKKTRITYYDMGDVSDAWAYYDVDEIFSFQDDREIVLELFPKMTQDLLFKGFFCHDSALSSICGLFSVSPARSISMTSTGIRTICMMMPGMALVTAPARNSAQVKLFPDRPARTRRAMPQTIRPAIMDRIRTR